MRQLIFFAWEHMLLSNVRRAGGPNIAHAELAQARRRLPHYAMPGTDAKARGNRRVAEGILALVTLLEEEYGQVRADAFDLTKTVVCATGRNLSVLTMKLWLAVSPDPLSTLPIRVTRGAALSGTFTLHFRRTETVHPRRCGIRAPKSFEA